MMSFFGLPTNSGQDPDHRQRTSIVVMAGLVVVMFGFVLMFMLRAGIASPTWILLVGLVLVILMVAAMGIVAVARSGKRKRSLDGLDMYSLIDRMVDDLDEDEMAYLQRRLDAVNSKKHDQLAGSLDELLDQRAEAKRAGQR